VSSHRATVPDQPGGEGGTTQAVPPSMASRAHPEPLRQDNHQEPGPILDPRRRPDRRKRMESPVRRHLRSHLAHQSPQRTIVVDAIATTPPHASASHRSQLHMLRMNAETIVLSRWLFIVVLALIRIYDRSLTRLQCQNTIPARYAISQRMHLPAIRTIGGRPRSDGPEVSRAPSRSSLARPKGEALGVFDVERTVVATASIDPHRSRTGTGPLSLIHT